MDYPFDGSRGIDADTISNQVPSERLKNGFRFQFLHATGKLHAVYSLRYTAHLFNPQLSGFSTIVNNAEL